MSVYFFATLASSPAEVGTTGRNVQPPSAQETILARADR